MKKWIWSTKIICLAMLVMLSGELAAQQGLKDLSGYIPDMDEIPGWKLIGIPESYRGDNLFMMINGGAELFHEYEFVQALRASFSTVNENTITVELYEMKDAVSAYGIYSYKTSAYEISVPIGQEARLEDYYLMFWKGHFLITVVGQDSDQKNIEDIKTIARFVEFRILQSGDRPQLTELILKDPSTITNTKYIRGFLGLMSGYAFDTKNIFQVREGMMGNVGDCQFFVFQYMDDLESISAFKSAVSSLQKSPRFTNNGIHKNLYQMTDRENKLVLINQIGRYISIVIGIKRNEVEKILVLLNVKLK